MHKIVRKVEAIACIETYAISQKVYLEEQTPSDLSQTGAEAGSERIDYKNR